MIADADFLSRGGGGIRQGFSRHASPRKSVGFGLNILHAFTHLPSVQRRVPGLSRVPSVPGLRLEPGALTPALAVLCRDTEPFSPLW